MDYQLNMFEAMGLPDIEEKKSDSPYSEKTGALIYEPNGICPPHILELFNDQKYRRLMRNIERSSVSEQEKDFLRYAACRHIVFNYSKIADYYAHADAQMQQLMEESALVIIDFNKAIANGYVNLSKGIRNIQMKTGVWASSSPSKSDSE